MKVLVTGGAGFVGSHIAELYAQQGNEVVIFDNLSRGKTLKAAMQPDYNVNYLKKYKNVSFEKGDTWNEDQVLQSAKGADVIFHTAAQVAVTTSLLDPRSDFMMNAMGSFNVLEAARHNDSMVVLTSTNKVYGDNVNSLQLEEKGKRYEFGEAYKNGIPETFSIDLTGHSPYGSSKLAADIYTQDYSHTYGLKSGVFRMSCIYGDRQFGVEDQGWVTWFVIAALSGKKIKIYGDGKQVRDVLYINDLTAAFDLFIKSNLKHEVFNIGGGKDNTLSLIELLEMIKELTGKSPELEYVDWRASDQKVYISDIRKISEKLGWKPKTSPAAGVKEIISWVEQEMKL